ncbi:MAG: FecR domain-containing protein [Alphaproteobacteria bacterium]|nr:FecR domain-containing protein [Alphaproteobacteria bacterium]
MQPSWAQQQQAGVTAAVRGRVEIAVAVGAVGREAKSGEPVYLGNRVKSGPESGLQILLLDQTTFTIGPDSELVIDEFVYDPAKGSGKVTASVVKGVFRFVTGQVAKNNPADMLVKMPIGTIGIRGTIAMGSVVPASGQTPAYQEVALLGPGRDRDTKDRRGALVLSAPNGSSVVIDQAGFGSSFGRDGQGWSEASKWTPERLAALQARLARAFTPGQSSGTGEAGDASRNANASSGDSGAQLASLLGGASNFFDTIRDDQLTDTRRSNGQTAMVGLVVPDGSSTFDQLRTVSSGQAYYTGTSALTSGGTYTIFANIDFGGRTFGGGNSRAVFNSPGQFSGTVSLGTLNYGGSNGTAAFQYLNTTSIGGLGCQTFSCRTTINITPQNANGTIAASASHNVLVQRVDSLGNPTANLATGSGTATRTPGQAP